MQGQDSVLLLVIIACAGAALNAGSEFAAGLLFALGLFRFQFVVPIAFLFLLWRRWRLVAGFVCSGIAMVGVSIAVAGISASRTYAQTLLELSKGAEGPYHQPLWLMPSLRGLVYGLFGAALSADAIRDVSVLVALAVCVWLAALRPQRHQLSVAIIAAALLSYHLLVHDLTILLLPIAFTLNDFISAPHGNTFWAKAAIWSAGAVFVAPAMLIFGTHEFYLVALVIAAFLISTVKVYRAAPAASGMAQTETA